MDNQRFVEKLRRKLNIDVARRLLIKYFVDKGFDNFNGTIYPPLLSDMPKAIPQLFDKIEVKPHVESINTMLDSAVLGWNLFVLGNQRQYLGTTYHSNLRELAMQLHSGVISDNSQSASHLTTPKQIVAFVVRVLETHESGLVDLTRKEVPTSLNKMKLGGHSLANQFYTRPGIK